MSEQYFEALAGGAYRLKGELTFASVPAVQAEGQTLLQQAEVSVLQLDGLGRVDSGGLALLISFLREAHQQGRRLQFTQVPEQLLRLARVSGVERILFMNTD